MHSRITRIVKIPIIFTTIFAVIFGFMCVGMFSKASMQVSGSNVKVVFADHSLACCSMGAMHHVDSWKNLTTLAPDKIRDFLILLAFSLAIGFSGSWLRLKHEQWPSDPNILRLRLYLRHNPDLILFNYLKIAFARGILNTKVY